MGTKRPDLFVVDGSNIATEGRSKPSLKQLNEAVDAFAEQWPDVKISIVVDATFGHRIAKSESKKFDAAVANNDIVAPPAGAVGRGDAFVLSIADRANAGVLSNDSFQEFHGDYEWLFDEGRLVGGKPVPHVGWVFVVRTPVRGPKSRQSIREAAEDAADSSEPVDGAKNRANRRVKKKAAAKPARRGKQAASSNDESASGDAAAAEQAAEPSDTSGSGTSRRRRSSKQRATVESKQQQQSSDDHVNELMPFLEFVEQHPIGTRVTGTVDSYSSHGAYARAADVLVYLPLRLMADPAPNKARDVVAIGDEVEVVVAGFVPDRRSIDAALPAMADTVEAVAPASPDEQSEGESKQPAKKRTAKKSAAKKSAAKKPTAKRAAAKKSAAKKAAAKKPAAKKAAAKKTAATKPLTKETTNKETTSKRSTSTRSRTSAATTTATKKPAAKKAATKKPAAKKAATKKPAAKKAAAKKPAAKKPAAKKAAAKKSAAKKSAAKKSAAKKRN